MSVLPSVVKWRNSSNRAIVNSKLRHIIPTANDLLASIHSAKDGITLTELLVQHPNLTRRTTQRHIAKLVDDRSTHLWPTNPGATRYRATRSLIVATSAFSSLLVEALTR